MDKLLHIIVKIKNRYNQFRARKKLINTDFSIISNNCWAATAVYQYFGLKYNTPTVGLFFMDEDYIKFLEKLDYYLSIDLEFIKPENSRYYDEISDKGSKSVSYPIATLKDIEVHFLHYKNEKEARLKWERRKKRINRGHLLIKMSLRDSGYDRQKMIARFTALPFNNKVCFVPEILEGVKNSKEVIVVPELSQLNLVGGDETEYTLKRIDVLSILNSIS